ncbi:hypothetical protein PPROV_000070900 [Pycnococcus provasolii]|uniref:S-adenosylmethionine-dependent methyltransferase domain-containing protein n=1 Tax=Pycnococcus provasolii TaxID=41880 RepID=A0A830H6N9_9CHLO|nr:hypothetical protein PPROV_000070900 [Pycnococcus provasolii]
MAAASHRLAPGAAHAPQASSARLRAKHAPAHMQNRTRARVPQCSGQLAGHASLTDMLEVAITTRERAEFFARAEREDTNAMRLFHGEEGCPGLAVDRYGSVALVQSWREPLNATQKAEVREFLLSRIPALNRVVFHLRGAAARRAAVESGDSLGTVREDEVNEDLTTFRELGLNYAFQPLRKGGDPSLFLDFRPVRRWVRDHSEGADVLNLFSYTCGIGVAAAAGGAASVLNVDHSQTYLDYGRTNAELNNVSMSNLAEDFFPAARQLAGLPMKGRAVRNGRGRRGARARRFSKMNPQCFDIVVLDPPTKTKTPFGAVDIKNDYAALSKPALLATRPGGVLVASNHAHDVLAEDWIESVVRCGKKAGRPVADARLLEVECDDDDFRSPNKPHLLKVGLFTTEFV